MRYRGPAEAGPYVRLLHAAGLHIDCRFRILRNTALPATRSHDEHHAAGPCRQHVGKGDEFEDESGKKERVKAEQPRHCEHCGGVEHFIDADPSKRSEEKLRGVDGDRDGIRRADVRRRQARRRLHPQEPTLYGREQLR